MIDNVIRVDIHVESISSGKRLKVLFDPLDKPWCIEVKVLFLPKILQKSLTDLLLTLPPKLLRGSLRHSATRSTQALKWRAYGGQH